MSANGYLTQSELHPLRGGYFAAPGPAAAWNAMGAEIEQQEGVSIRVNGPDSAYRNFARQVYWRNYWCGRGLCQNAAVPGTSNHGLGWAFDVPDYVSALMEKYGAKYGFKRVCSDAPWEGWHWKWCGGWSGHDPGPNGEGVMYPTLKKGDHGKAVKRAQKHLRRWNLGFTRPAIDGDFGDNTRKAVREFQILRHLKPDGVIGARTWKALRQKDHCLDDERLALNHLAFLRFKSVTAAERPKVRRNQQWCALRARSIARVASENGWHGLHRRERFKRLKRAAGSAFEDTHLPK